jgi:NADH-quinone oxidoreductase subunit J
VGTFAVSAAIILSGAIGVVVARNPVHAALMLVMTLFGVAVLFVLQRDPFLAAVQVIVYAGAIVVLFLFVIMFLGVDREENIAIEPLRGQRPLAAGLILLGTTGLLLLGEVSSWTTGAQHVAGVDAGAQSNVYLLGKSVYTTYLFPFEATAALLIIAVVGAVVLARRPPGSAVQPTEDEPEHTSGDADLSTGAAGLSPGGADLSPGAAELFSAGAELPSAGADLSASARATSATDEPGPGPGQDRHSAAEPAGAHEEGRA